MFAPTFNCQLTKKNVISMDEQLLLEARTRGKIINVQLTVDNIHLFRMERIIMNEELLVNLRKKAAGLPMHPGVYLMKNADGEVIYVGKAKLLRNRVSSYFHSIDRQQPKTGALVSLIANFDVILASNEFEALILESTLIKMHRPKYNILLKDDKGYPFIKVTVNEAFPRIMLARTREKDKAKYYGPFGGSIQAKQIIDAVCRAFRLPACDKKFKMIKGRPCLNSQIDRCVGLCSGKVTKEEYRELINSALDFFEGNTKKVFDEVEKKMLRASDNLDFEKAAYYRDILNAVKRLKNKQKAVGRSTLTADAVSFAAADNLICITVISVRNGILFSSISYIVKNIDSFETETVLNEYLSRFYEENTAIPPVLYCSIVPENKELLSEYLAYLKGSAAKIIKPLKGDGAALLKIAHINAVEYLKEYQGRTDRLSRSMDAFAAAAGFSKTPETIEIYDISQTAGQNAVAGLVVFQNGKPMKERYRKFNIENAAPSDDCAAIAEVLGRRIKRYKENDEGFNIMPDLIIADGGINQVNALKAVLIAENMDISVIGLKKDTRHRTKSIVRTDGAEIQLKNNLEAFRFAGIMQEEAHRFAISFHRSKNALGVKVSSLTEIEGVGKESAKKLLSHFKTIKAIKEASAEELLLIKGMSRKTAENIKAYFENQ